MYYTSKHNRTKLENCLCIIWDYTKMLSPKMESMHIEVLCRIGIFRFHIMAWTILIFYLSYSFLVF